MSSLFALLSQQTQSLQTRKGLIVLGLQNDFVLPDGKLPVNDTGYLNRITQLVPAFREFGAVIWVRSEYQGSRPVNGPNTPDDTVIVGGRSREDDTPPPKSEHRKHETSVSPQTSKAVPDASKTASRSSASFSKPSLVEDDDELFLTPTASREPCCLRGSRGVDYADGVKPLIQQGTDLQFIQSHYSAFGATSLLLTLRSKLITELFVCGNTTNLTVYATAMDAARYGIQITLLEDCLGYRHRDRHEAAIKQLCDFMEAEVMSADDALNVLRNPLIRPPVKVSAEPPEEDTYSDEEEECESEALNSVVDRESRPGVSGLSHATGALEVDSEDSGAESGTSLVRCDRTLGSFAHADKPSLHGCRSESPSGNFDRHTKANDTVNIDTRSNGHHSTGCSDSPKDPSCIKAWLELLPSDSSPKHNTPSKLVHRPKIRALAALGAATGLSPSTMLEYDARIQEARKETSVAGASKPLFGEDKKEESAGSCILEGLLPTHDARNIFEELNHEVHWQSMYHQTGEVPRLVCCQGKIAEDGSMPVYRHPSDHTIPLEHWTPAVDRVRKAAEKVAGHPLNHALIQLYRSGNDYISEHSDKTMDIVAGSNIVNVSFGAQRTMRLRTKRSAAQCGGTSITRTTYRIPMPHNSIITMSLKTNAEYLHGINWDRRPAVELVEAEKAFGGQRISLTFRNIGTFLNRDSSAIWGQGAVGKTKGDARPVVSGDREQGERMVCAFGAENQASTIVWEEIYGCGFDVLHLK